MSDPISIDDLFDRRLDFPDMGAARRLARLVGIDEAKSRLTKVLGVLVNPAGPREWAERHHKGAATALDYLERRPPLVILAGDVGTGKTALSETVGDAVARQEKIGVTLYPLSLATRGSGRVGEMTKLLSAAFDATLSAAEKLKRSSGKATGGIIFLVDEIECHLHPQWQRRVVPALLRVMQALTGKKVPVQLIVATHSPLVLASVEPEFDEDKDAVFNIQLDGGQACVTKELWAKQGDVVNWLVSDAFGLRQARSIDAERAIEAAEAWMRGDKLVLPSNLKTQAAIHKELQRVLAGHDDFWPRWLVETQQIPGSKPKGGA